MFAVFVWIDMAILSYLAWSYRSVPSESEPDAWIKALEEEKLAKAKTT